MLVLTRKVHKIIRIGDNIEIEVLQIKGGGVRLGIRAPREVPVVRQEILGRAAKTESPESEDDQPAESLPEEPPLLGVVCSQSLSALVS
jgi:carbon storage regulator